MMKKTQMRPLGLPGGGSFPMVTPIMPSVVYAAATPDALDHMYENGGGYVYAREGHPNASVLAARIDALEGAQGGIVTGSGMAAVTAVLYGLLRSGDRVVGGDQLYGRSLRMMTQDLPRMGITCVLADACDATAMRDAITPETRLVMIEIVSNPTLRIADVDGIVERCKEVGALLVVDNTFTTPRGFLPFDRGADIVLHSVTKLLAGHADATLGYVAAKDPKIMAEIDGCAQTMGLTASPFDCWLAERGLMTFDLRFDRAQDTARRLADHLSGQDGILQVIYPGRSDHPDHARAQSVLRGQPGNMVSFELNGDRAQTNVFTQAMSDLSFAPTLGDVSTTLSHPVSSSHRSVADTDRRALGITEGFFRVSVGLEEPDSLLAAFDAGLDAVRSM